MNYSYLILVLAIAGIITYLTRLLPFVAFKKHSEHPVLNELSRNLPFGVMVILVCYTLSDLDLTQASSWLPALFGCLTAAILYLYKDSVLLAITSAVLVYAGTQVLF